MELLAKAETSVNLPAYVNKGKEYARWVVGIFRGNLPMHQCMNSSRKEKEANPRYGYADYAPERSSALPLEASK